MSSNSESEYSLDLRSIMSFQNAHYQSSFRYEDHSFEEEVNADAEGRDEADHNDDESLLHESELGDEEPSAEAASADEACADEASALEASAVEAGAEEAGAEATAAEESTSATPSIRKKSWIWHYFTVTKQGSTRLVKCNLCDFAKEHPPTSTTSKLQYHLTHTHRKTRLESLTLIKDNI